MASDSASDSPKGQQLSRDRLHQIALRKLQSLGVLTRLVPERDALEGDLIFKTGKVLQPGTQQMVQRARFTVEGHDVMRFVDAPLDALGPVGFYDVATPTALEERIAASIRQRMAALEPWRARLERLKLPVGFDPRTLTVRSEVRASQHRFELSAGPTGLRVTRVQPLHGPAVEVSADYPALRLEDYGSGVDLEIFLSHDVARMAQPRPAARAQPTSTGPAPVQRLAPPAGSLSLARVLEKLGNDVTLAAEAPLELTVDFSRGPERLRFTATRQGGSTFLGRLQSQSGVLWSEAFELDRFPGTEALIRHVLGTAAAAQAQETGAPAEVPNHLAPHPGEVWVMNVLVEAEGPDEVRYVCTNTDGAPYGASRVLRRADFESAFVKMSGGFRLLIRIETVERESVTYTQLDGQRQPRGQLKRLATPVLVSTFIPEAAAY